MRALTISLAVFAACVGTGCGSLLGITDLPIDMSEAGLGADGLGTDDAAGSVDGATASSDAVSNVGSNDDGGREASIGSMSGAGDSGSDVRMSEIGDTGNTACSPMQTQCASGANAVQTCDPSGQWGSPVACAGATGEVCQAGVCQCPTGQTVCNGACVDEATDSNNCGGCGVQCSAAMFSGSAERRHEV